MKTSFETVDGATINIPEDTVCHLQAHPDVWDVIEEAILKVDTKGEDLVLAEVDLGRVVGRSGAVKLDSTPLSMTNKLQFAKRIGRTNWSRVATTTDGPEVSTVVVIAKKEVDGQYSLLTSYIGWLSEREPSDPNLLVGDVPPTLEWWKDYALVYDQSTFGEVVEMTWPEAIFRVGKGKN